MHFLLLIALFFPAKSPPPGAPPTGIAPAGDPECAGAFNLHRAESGNKAAMKRLGELPPGELVLTVVREVDGCHKPVIVRDGYGALGRESRR